MHFYLRNGWHEDHGVARGPMAPVIGNLAMIADDGLRAMTTYLAGFLETPSEERRKTAQALVERAKSRVEGKSASLEIQTVGQSHRGGDTQESGARIYEALCASCHDGNSLLPFGGIDLALSTGPNGPNARNVMNVVLWGLPPADG